MIGQKISQGFKRAFRLSKFKFQEENIEEIQNLLKDAQNSLKSSNIPETIHFCKKALTISKKSSLSISVYQLLYSVYMRNNDLNNALVLIDEALQNHPNSIELELGKGNTLLRMRQYVTAIRIFESIQSKSPNFPSLNLSLGTAYLKADCPGLAQEKFKDSVKYDPNCEPELTHIYLGLTYLKNGDQENFEKYINLSKTFNKEKAEGFIKALK
jgi:tetratricopeptide (TPR) repeat protein